MAKMVSQFGEWQNDQLGAGQDQDLDWRWHGQANNQKIIWVSNGAGEPVSTIGTDTGRTVFARLLIGQDLIQSSLINYHGKRAVESECDMKIKLNYFTAGSLTEEESKIPASST